MNQNVTILQGGPLRVINGVIPSGKQTSSNGGFPTDPMGFRFRFVTLTRIMKIL